LKKKLFALISFVLISLTAGLIFVENKNNVVYAASETYNITFDEFSTNVVDMFSYDEQDFQFINFSIEEDFDSNEIKRFNRLIVKSYASLNNWRAIAESGIFNGFQIFQYSSREETDIAYNYFLSLDSVEYVEYDYEITACSVAETTEEKTYVNDYYDDIGADVFNNFLVNEVGLDKLNDVVVAKLRYTSNKFRLKNII